MSNPAFRAALKAKKLWRQLINGIKKILGMDVLESGEGATTAFEILDRALNVILDMYDASAYRDYTASPLAQVRYMTVEDEATNKMLDSHPYKVVYRAMQVIGGKLYSPMASGKGKKLGQPYGLNQWDVASELAFNLTDKMLADIERLNNSTEKGYVEVIPGVLRFVKGSKKGKCSLKFHLVTEETDVWAAYNPYQHNSDSMLNDQFSAAYRRGNIVVVKAIIPVAEVSRGGKMKYKAEHAKNSTGTVKWKAGPVAGKMPAEMARKVYLSRYCKPVAVLSNTEVANWIADRIRKAEQLTCERIPLPEKSFHPEVKRIMEGMGFEFIPVTWPKGKVSKVMPGHADYMTDEAIAKLNESLGADSKWMMKVKEPKKINEKKQAYRKRFAELQTMVEKIKGYVFPGLSTKIVNVVAVNKHKFHGESKIADALKWAKKALKNTYVTRDGFGNELTYSISNTTVEKFLSDSAVSKSHNLDVHLSILQQLPAVIENGVEAECHASYNKDATGKRRVENGVNKETIVHRFYSAVKLEGKMYRVKTTIKESLANNGIGTAYTYQVENIEVTAEKSTITSIRAGESIETGQSTLEAAKLLKGVEKSYEPGVKLLDASQTDQHQRQNDESGDRMRPGRQQSAGVQQSEREQMQAEVEGMVKRLRLGGRVTVLTSTEGLDGKYARAKGWFDTKTGKIVIVLPNHTSAVDAVKTVLHEAVGHYGLRQMFGVHFEQFLDNVYKHSELIVRKRIDALMAKHGYSRRVATEEYLSALAERQTDTKRFGGVLKTVRLWFKRMLASMGVLDMTNFASFELTDNELSYILWASRRALERNGKLTTVMQQAADVAMRYKLKVGEFMNGVIRQRSAAVDRDKRRHEYFMAHEMRPVWAKAKTRHPNAVVMVDIGGRYITFGQDANKAAKALKRVINQDIGSRDNLRVGYRAGDQLTVPAYRSAEHFKMIAAAGYPVVVIGKPGSNPNRYDEYEREQSEFEADYLDGERVAITYEDSPYYVEPKNPYPSFDKLKRPEKDDMVMEVPTDASLTAEQMQSKRTQSSGKTGDSTFDNWSRLKKLALPGNVALLETGNAFIAYNEDAEKLANSTGVPLIRKRLPDGSTVLMAGFEAVDKDECFAKLRAAGSGIVTLTEENCQLLVNEPGGEYGLKATDVAETNRRFNEDIDRYNDGTLPIGYRFDLGMPSKWLQAAGFPELPISLRKSVIDNKSVLDRHLFEASDLKNLVYAIQRPIAVFPYTKPNMRNVIVDLKRGSKHFLVGVTLNYKAGDVEINSVSGLFPRDTVDWLLWIQKGKAIQIEQKNKVLDIINSQRNTITVESERLGLDLDLVANITTNFKNPPLISQTDQHQRQNDQSEGPSELFRTIDLNDEVATEERSAAALLYEERARSASFQVREAWQDSMLGLRALYESIERSKGRRTRIEDIAGNENAYIFENRLSSLNHEQQKVYRKMFIEPLTAEVSRLCGFGKVRGKKAEANRLELTRYMMAKHGLERNALMRQKAIEAAVDGGIEQAVAEKVYGERDFAGLTGLYAEVNGQQADVATAELWAQQWTEQYEQRVQTDELWRLVDAATKQTLNTLVQGGVLSADRRREIADMYKHYIPLRGWNATTADEVYGYLTRGEHPGNGSILKKAEGRASVADDPLSMIALMGEHGIAQANRNQMKRTFLNYVRNNPSDLVSINRLWLKYDASSDSWLPAILHQPTRLHAPQSPDVEAQGRHVCDRARVELAGDARCVVGVGEDCVVAVEVFVWFHGVVLLEVFLYLCGLIF